MLASSSGLGDSAALYACYGLHLQGCYLDHPPLIGLLTRAVTAVAGESSLGVRLVPILLFPATAFLLHDLAASISGRPRAGFLAVLLLVASPVYFIGGLASTPDAPASLFWMLAVWLAWKDVSLSIPDRRPVTRGVLVGLALGLCVLSKFTGILLGAAYLTFLAAARRRWLLTYAVPAMLVAASCSLPVVVWNATHGWASVMHRLVWTQGGAGFSPRNLGALLGGQLLYVSPVLAVLILVSMWKLWKERRGPDSGRLILALSWLPAVPLWILCLWSRVAEPHWPVMAYLPILAVVADSWAGGSGSPVFRKSTTVAAWVAAAMTATGLVAAGTPWLTRAGVVDPATDITNELMGWDRVAAKVAQVTPEDAIIVGPHWTVCAQAEWGMRATCPSGRTVSCLTAERDDWDYWLPVDPRDPDTWKRLHYVTHDRWRHVDASILTLYASLLAKIEVERGGRIVRTFRGYRR